MKNIGVALLGLSIAFSSSVLAKEFDYRFTYSKLFSQMKVNAEEGHDDVKVAFFFVNAKTKQLCDVDKAWMEKEKHYEELKTSSSKELLIPLDNNLRQANPLVFINTEGSEQCDFSTVVMTKQPLQGSVSYEKIAEIVPQMQSLLEQLGGMFSGWFTPEITGITLEFNNELNSYIQVSDGSTIPIISGKAQITLAELGEGNSITLPEPTLRVLPFLPAANH